MNTTKPKATIINASIFVSLHFFQFMEEFIVNAQVSSILEAAKMVFTPEFLERLHSEHGSEDTATILAEAMQFLIALKRIEFKSESTPTAEAKGGTVHLK